MAYLLDTCALSDYLKGNIPTIKNLMAKKPRDVRICSITVFEIEFGLRLKPSLVKTMKPQLKAIYQKIKIIDFSILEANAAANIRKDLKQAGTPIGYYDLLIAATAQANNLILVTSNTEEFSRVENLRIENWRL